MAIYDKPIPVTCPACLAQEEADAIFEIAIEWGQPIEEMIKHNFDYLWSEHKWEPGCTFHPFHLGSRTLPCGCFTNLLGLPRGSDGKYEPDAVREHVTACQAREFAERIADKHQSPATRSTRATIFKGIESPNERRPDWFWELWIRRPSRPGSADDLYPV